MIDLGKVEKFARKIICMADDDILTVGELEVAADMVKKIAKESIVCKVAIGSYDFPSHHIRPEVQTNYSDVLK